MENYIDIAKKINKSKSIKLVNIQHEFGIFGGDCGSHIIPFLEILKKPLITTFHSIVPKPSEKRKKAVRFIASKSDCIVVMNKTAVDILRKGYDLKGDIAVIPHGIPSVKFDSSRLEKAKLDFKNRIILSSFGMMNPGKGYEYVIDALPKIVKKFPNILYIIVGETHPVVRMEEGEKYRNFLQRRVKKLGMSRHVKFYNKYVTLDEIIKYLKASDLYISSSTDPKQITSGTLVYAMGCGRAVVSTPFLHAREYVTPERGILAEFGKPQSFANAIIKVLSNPELKKSMQRNAYAFTRSMTWPNIALCYMKLFDKYVKISDRHEKRLPKIKFSHLINMTDNFGIMQFAKYTTPNKRFGYCLDDNSRALIAVCMHYKIFGSKPRLKLVRTYLNFIKYVSQNNGMFFNFVDYNRKHDMNELSEDSFGRALTSLGYLISLDNMPPDILRDAEKIFKNSTQRLAELQSPRAIAFSIISLYHYNASRASNENIMLIRELADKLVQLYNNCSSQEWRWFEEYMTYSNSRLPESLLYAYLATKDEKYLDVGRKSLDFLVSVTFENGVFEPIGQSGWYSRNGKKAKFDQQPVDAASMVQALLLAGNVTCDRDYTKKAMDAFYWFLGKNALNQMVYDEFTGGCHDGLGHSSVNMNQGAESTISYLLARLSLEEAQHLRNPKN